MECGSVGSRKDGVRVEQSWLLLEGLLSTGAGKRLRQLSEDKRLERRRDRLDSKGQGTETH